MLNPKDQTRGRVGRALAVRRFALVCFAAATTLLPLSAAAKTKANAVSPAATSIELKATLAEAVQAVGEVAADPILYGTYVYEHDKTLIGAREADDSSAFGNDKPPGKIYYKVIDDVVAPRHFKDTEDSGTITIRYVLRELTPATVNLRIDAIFITHKVPHASQGAVETAEFGQVQQRLDRIQAREREEAEQRRAEAGGAPAPQKPLPTAAPAVVEYQASESSSDQAVPMALDAQPNAAPMPPAPKTAVSPDSVPAGSVAELEQRIARLRHQVEAVVKAPGAELRSSPFHTAKAIQTIPAKSEVAIVILTPYWYGVQTTDGHTGWIQRSQLESLP